ncbi:MAG: transposase [Verrucomicrobia bacterium]|nr:transposase [Verrucomicrobiota bacterium]
MKLFSEGCGVRAISRLTNSHTQTVLSVLETVGEKLAQFLDTRIRNIEVEWGLQIDEIWSRVAIRQSRTTPADRERGDFYTFLALDARTKLIVSNYTGKRDYESTDIFAADVASRVKGRVQITTDGWAAYPDTIRKYLLERLDYAVMQKNYDATPGEVEAKRRYSPAPFVGVTVEIRAGNPRRDRICTSFVERANLSVRHFNKRFVRLGLGWSRKLANHRHAVTIFVATHNFCKVHKTLGCAPAVGAKLTDHTWTIEELLAEATKQ